METKTPETQVSETPAVPIPKKKRKWLKRLIAIVVVAVLLVVLLSRCMGGGGGLSAGTYLTASVSHQDMEVTVTGAGTITPIHSFRVTSLVSGEILEAPFEEGDSVKKGDVLFRIDSKDVESNIQQQEINLRNAQLSYETLLASQSDGGAVTANGSGVITTLYVEQGDTVAAGAPIADILDRVNMKLELPFQSADAAHISVGQTATISVSGTLETLTGTVESIAATDTVGAGGALVRNVTIQVVNPGALTDSSTGSAVIGGYGCAATGTFSYGSSKQVVAKTSGELVSLTVKEGDAVTDGQVIGSFDNTANDNQLESARLAVESAELALQNAKDQLENYTITSPIDGTVIEKNYEVGDTLDMSASAATVTYPAVIYDLSTLTFDLNVHELDISKIQVGQTVEITASALEGQTFTGVVDKVNINGTTTGNRTTYPVTIVVDGAPSELYPGMNVSATILVEDVGNVLCIPVDYVSRGNTVLVAGEGCLDENGNVTDLSKIETREVTLGRSNDEYIEILSGLEEGETVLMENQASNWITG